MVVSRPEAVAGKDNARFDTLACGDLVFCPTGFCAFPVSLVYFTAIWAAFSRCCTCKRFTAVNADADVCGVVYKRLVAVSDSIRQSAERFV